MNSNTEKHKDLEYFRKLQYEVLVKKVKRRFIVFIRELAMVEEDESLDKAYEKLESQKEKYFQEMIENEYQDYIKGPKGRKIVKTSIFNISDLTNYLIKLTITAVIIAILGFVGMRVTLEKVRHETQNIVNIVDEFKRAKRSYIDNAPEIIIGQSRNLARRLIIGIDNMPDEKKEKRRLILREAIKQAKPFFDEFRVLFQDSPTGELEKKSSP